MIFHLANLLEWVASILLIAVPSIVLGTWGVLVLYYSKKKTAAGLRGAEENFQYQPRVSIVLPTHNEADVISKRIWNLLESSYPAEKLDIIIVDDSTDSTPEIVREYMKTCSQIQLIRFEKRMGYSRSLIVGCQAAEGEIVVLSEASSLMDRSAIPLLVSNFRDPTVGVVTGKSIILNLDEGMGRSESAYLKFLDLVRQGESNMHSTAFMKGEAAAVRKDLVRDLEDLNDCPGTADTGIAFHVAKMGYRAIYDSRVKFYEYAPSTRQGRVQQKVTRGANLIKILWKFKFMFFRRKYGKFGWIVLPMDFAMLTLVPVSLFLGVLFLGLLSIVNPIASIPIWTIIMCLLLIGSMYSRTLVSTFFEFEYSLLIAIYEILVTRRVHDMIEKVASTRRIASDPFSGTEERTSESIPVHHDKDLEVEAG